MIKELILVKIKKMQPSLNHLLQAAEYFQTAVYQEQEHIILTVTLPASAVDSFIAKCKKYTGIEIVRSGASAIEY